VNTSGTSGAGESAIDGRMAASEKRWNKALRVEKIIIFANVRGQMPPLAFGLAPAREAGSAGARPKVPQGRGLSGPHC